MKNIYKCTICGKYVEEPVHCSKPAKLVLEGKRRLSLSKLLSYILRHDPQIVKVNMDNEGWVPINELVHNIKTSCKNKHLYWWLIKEHIHALVYLDPKGRFEIKNNSIRARYGHSAKLRIRIVYPEDVKSKTLYHGTLAEKLNSILKEGLKPMKRAFVHLAVDLKDACLIAKRHGYKTVLLIINCDCLRNHGLKIYVASEKVRLVKYVPSVCISKIMLCV